MVKESTQPYFMGIDIGTGSTKAIAISTKGAIIAKTQQFYPTENFHPGYSEQDPEIIWNAFKNVIKKIVNDLRYPPVSISLSSAMHGLIAVNQQNKPITLLINWADTRSEEIAERIHTSSEAESIYKATGTPIHAMSPLCKIVWLRENQPSIFRKTAKFISIKEYIWYKLFKVYEIDHSIASATGLFNIESLEWYGPSLKLCQISPGQLSQPLPTDTFRKNVSAPVQKILAISPGTTFCIGGSDGCLANLGSYAIDKGTAALTIGTSGAVRIASNKPVFNFGEMTFNYVLDKNTFICGGPVNNGGNILPWLFETFLKIKNPTEKDYRLLFRQMDTVPSGSKGLVFLPYLHGERAPVWDGRSSGVFFGIKPFHTNACFLRAALEGICYSLNQVLKIVESSTEKIDHLIVGGGFIHSKTWLKILADITGKKIFVFETEDSSAVGAALLNMKAMGIIASYDSFKPAASQTIVPDSANHARHEANYSIFLKLYQALKELMHQDYQNSN